VINEDYIIISVYGAVLAKFTETGSMLPTITGTANAIEIIPGSDSEIQLGDIISYNLNNETIIHRVIEISSDSEGWYAVTKGDNIPMADLEKVRFEQIERVVVGIIY
jgi:signal peptidase I